ncbi:MAG: hypothetical protein WCQ99_15885, partial [Pseudomonadota bacterium]
MQKIPVSLFLVFIFILNFFIKEASALPPPLYVFPGQIDFGQQKTEAIFRIANYGDESRVLFAKVIYQYDHKNSGWLTLDSPIVTLDSQDNDTVTVTVNREGLEPGTYKAVITYDVLHDDAPVAGNGADVSITMVVASPDDARPSLAVSSSFVFIKRNQASFEIKLQNTGAGALVWNEDDSDYSKKCKEWISLYPSGGSIEAGKDVIVTFTVNRTYLQKFRLYRSRIALVST